MHKQVLKFFAMYARSLADKVIERQSQFAISNALQSKDCRQRGHNVLFLFMFIQIHAGEITGYTWCIALLFPEAWMFIKGRSPGLFGVYRLPAKKQQWLNDKPVTELTVAGTAGDFNPVPF